MFLIVSISAIVILLQEFSLSQIRVQSLLCLMQLLQIAMYYVVAIGSNWKLLDGNIVTNQNFV